MPPSPSMQLSELLQRFCNSSSLLLLLRLGRACSMLAPGSPARPGMRLAPTRDLHAWLGPSPAPQTAQAASAQASKKVEEFRSVRGEQDVHGGGVVPLDGRVASAPTPLPVLHG